MKRTLKVEGMSCDHCIRRITNAINEIEGAKCLEISLKDKMVLVDSNNDEVFENIKNAINEVGYEVIEDEE
jgi:copper ion binding protein